MNTENTVCRTTPEPISQRIRRARRAANLNQSQLARAVGVTRASVSFWENGQTLHLEGTHLERVCTVLKVTPQYLLYGRGKDPAPAVTMTGPTPLDVTGLTVAQRDYVAALVRLLADQDRCGINLLGP